jgi:hypothetical protein
VVAIRNAGPPLSEDDIVDFERRIRCRLPDSYRRFLKENNGGRPPLDADGIGIEHLPGGETDVGDFFGLTRSISSSNIDWNLKVHANRISDRLLPIARDSFGNIFCLSLDESDYGGVVYCDFDPTVHLGGAIYYRVAPDFDSFLEKIRSIEDN